MVFCLFVCLFVCFVHLLKYLLSVVIVAADLTHLHFFIDITEEKLRLDFSLAYLSRADGICEGS